MIRRSIGLLALAVIAGCGGAQQTPTPLSPVNSSATPGTGVAGGTAAGAVFKPTLGANTPLGTLKTMAEHSPLASAPPGKVDKDGAAKLAKLDKDPIKLDDAYSYFVADSSAPRASVGDKGATVPLPADAKPNPDGSVWVVDADARRVYTLTGVKRDADKDKPATVAEEKNSDLVHPTIDAEVPPLALAARAEEASAETKHALRIVAKGVGTDGAPAAGTRIRLKKGPSEKDATLLVKSLMRSLKKYGAILEPGDGAPALSAVADPRWTKEDEKAFAVLHLTDFEIVTPPVKTVNSTKTGK